MDKKVGDRIKDLRQKKGLTQAELADNMGFTSQTVSNWESGAREPDIEALIKLSSLFNVSLDYLLSGKEQEEKVVIMSRIEMAAKKDDPSIIQDLRWDTNYTKDENGKTIMDYVIQYKSRKVFEVMLNSCSHQSHYDALFNCQYFNSFSNKNLKIIEFLLPYKKELDFARAYGISEIRLLNEFAPAFVNQKSYSAKAKEEMLETYQNIFNYLVENIDRLGDERKEYYFGLNTQLLDRKNCWSYAYPNFIDIALKKGNIKLFDQLLEKVRTALNALNARIEEMKAQGYGSDQIYRSTLNYFSERPLEQTYSYAFENEMFDQCELINSFLPNKHSQREIDLAKMKTNKNVDIRDRLIFEFTQDYVLNYKNMLLSDTVVVKGPSKEENKDKYLENLIKQYKDIYKDILSNSCIYYLELAYRCVADNNLKKLYQVAVDNDFGIMQQLIIAGDTKELLSYLRLVLTIKSEEIEKVEVYRPYGYSGKLQIKQRLFEQNRIDYNKPGKMQHYIEQTPLDLIFKWHRGLVIDSEVPEDINEALKYFDNSKKQILEKWEADIESQIESLKTRKKNEAEYKRIKEEITKDYLNGLIKKGDEEKAIIKLCVRLESILKHLFHYEGDLFTMLDSFFSNQLAQKEATMPYDDEDNNYRSDMENYEKTVELNEKNKNWVNALHKLRMKRNSIVHSDKNNVEFTTNDLISCINIVEEIDKGE